jgi:hypothetical protein
LPEAFEFLPKHPGFLSPSRFLMVARGTPFLISHPTMQHFPEIQLTFQEARVLGCLLEKEILTPGSYPLTHNSLLIACNQTSSRDPITHFTGEEVSEALRGPAAVDELERWQRIRRLLQRRSAGCGNSPLQWTLAFLVAATAVAVLYHLRSGPYWFHRPSKAPEFQRAPEITPPPSIRPSP